MQTKFEQLAAADKLRYETEKAQATQQELAVSR
jgi:hypothetical protein